MKKKLLLFTLLCLEHLAIGQTCPSLISPLDGATDVAVDATIIWNPAEGVPGYRIRLGTTPGGSEITEVSVGSATSYTPQLGLPENTTIYVTIILDFLFIGSEDIVCESQSFTTEDVTIPPACTSITVPSDGASNVSVFSNISWVYSPTATGYLLNLGTTPGGNDLGTIDVGNTLSFNPPDFPPNTTIYVQLIPYNENGQSLPCTEISFTTGELVALPGCTSLINPLNGAQNIPLTPLIEWNPVSGATGYRLTIGSTPDGSDVLDNAVFTATSTFVLDFEPNRTFFVTIIPFNDSGDAIGCGQETFSTQLGCGPYLDLATGELVTLYPEFEFPDSFSFCENEAPLLIEGPEIADGYRWFQIDQFGNLDLMSEEKDFEVTENGNYALEAYIVVDQFGENLECPTYTEFEVVSSEIATINGLQVENGPLGLNVTVQASGNGDFEYAVDDSNGPYQDSNAFFDLELENHVFYVRDKNGCGTVEEFLEIDLTLDGFPKFFTPNGDNQNDYWQFVQPIDGREILFRSITIYDRYGKLIKQISQDTKGWDGTYLGKPLPAGGMWFKAVDEDNRVYNGYFTLKR